MAATRKNTEGLRRLFVELLLILLSIPVSADRMIVFPRATMIPAGMYYCRIIVVRHLL